MALRPSDASRYTDLCESLNALGRSVEAAEACDRAVELDPESFSAYLGYLGLGEARSRQGRHDEAVDAFRKAAYLRPGYGPPLAWLAREFLRVGDTRAACVQVDALKRLGKGSIPDDALEILKGVDLAALCVNVES